MSSPNFSIELSSSLLAKAKNFLLNIDLNESKKQIILGSIGVSLGGLYLLNLYMNQGTKKIFVEFDQEKEKPETKETIKEDKEKTSQILMNNSKTNPSLVKNSSRNIDVKTSHLLKNSMKTAKNNEDDAVHKLPTKNNISTKLKERNVFREYTSFEEDLECDSLSTKEERQIHHRRRVTSYYTDNELKSKTIKAKRHQILSMAKEGEPSDQLFFKLYANLSHENEDEE